MYMCTVSSTEPILVRVLNAKSGTSANLGQMPQLMVISQLLLQSPDSSSSSLEAPAESPPRTPLRMQGWLRSIRAASPPHPHTFLGTALLKTPVLLNTHHGSVSGFKTPMNALVVRTGLLAGCCRRSPELEAWEPHLLLLPPEDTALTSHHPCPGPTPVSSPLSDATTSRLHVS